MKCNWQFAWTGRKCENKATITGMCEEHTKKCTSCDRMAIKECEVAGSFVCGYPICGSKECDHIRNHYKRK